MDDGAVDLVAARSGPCHVLTAGGDSPHHDFEAIAIGRPQRILALELGPMRQPLHRSKDRVLHCVARPSHAPHETAGAGRRVEQRHLEPGRAALAAVNARCRQAPVIACRGLEVTGGHQDAVHAVVAKDADWIGARGNVVHGHRIIHSQSRWRTPMRTFKEHQGQKYSYYKMLSWQ